MKTLRKWTILAAMAGSTLMQANCTMQAKDAAIGAFADYVGLVATQTLETALPLDVFGT